MKTALSVCLRSGLALLLTASLVAPQPLHAQGPPPPQVLQDGLIPSDLHDLYTALNLQPDPDAPLFAYAPARAMEAYHYSWTGLAGDEAGFHEGEDFGTVRTLGPGEFRAIGRSQGRFGEVVVRQEEATEEGFDRWVYYTYADGRPIGMAEVLQPVASVTVAADGSEGTFVIEDPDGHTGSGYFARAGWKVEDGRTIHWIEGAPEPAFSATVLRYHEERGEAVGHFLNSDGELLGVLRYDRASGAGSFAAPGRNDGQPICWNAAMQNATCDPAEGMDSEDWTSEDPEAVKERFGFQFTPDLDMDLAASYGGHEAVQFEARSGYGEMGTLVRHLMVFHEGMRHGVTVNVAYMLEYGDGRDKMEELVGWMENEVLIEIPH